MAAGILSGMEGKRGIRAWRWLFIIEVTLTALVFGKYQWAFTGSAHSVHWVSVHVCHLLRLDGLVLIYVFC